jgi:hypothetical protein
VAKKVLIWTTVGVVAFLCSLEPVDAQAVAPPEVEAAIVEASMVWGVPAPRLRCLYRKESGFRPWADDNPPYMGLAQFDVSTWNHARRVLRNPADPRYPLLSEGASPWVARDAALASAGLIARGEGGRWPPLRGC